MFTLWYTVLSYKEYKNSIWDKLAAKKPPAGFKETAIVSPLSSSTTEKNDATTKSPSSRISELEPASIKPPRNLPTQVPVPPVSRFPPISPILPSSNKSPTFPPQKIEPPPKPPRSPSPHPIRSEAFANNDNNIEYDEEDEAEETDESSEADEEENSVLATPHQHQRSMNNKPVAKTVNEFINKEKAT